MNAMLPLMIVPLMVWVAVWVYLWALDRKVARLRAEVDRLKVSDKGQDTP